MGHGNIFEFDTKSTNNNTKNKQMGLFPNKSYCTAKENNKMKGDLQHGRKSFQTIYLIRG